MDPAVGATLEPGIRCVLLPAVPTKLSPPGVSLQGVFPGREAPKIIQVAWSVNDRDAGNGTSLDSSRFGKGDRIQAKVRVLSRGTEGIVEVPAVVAGNSPPWVVEAGIEPAGLTTGSVARAVVRIEDPDGDPVTARYTWYVDDRPASEEGETFRLQGIRKGSTVHFKAVPGDGSTDGGWRYSGKYTVVNSSPVVKSDPPKSIPPDGIIVYAIIAEDPDGDPLTYALEKGPAGMTLTGATLRWAVPPEAYGTSVQIVVRISDNDGGETLTTLSMTPRKD